MSNQHATTQQFAAQIAAELSLPPRGVTGALALLAEGSTVPFIARYRKEATGSFDEVQIRAVEERFAYLVELSSRKDTVLAAIEEQGKLTDDLRRAVLAAATKAQLEDLYLPYKKKRRTRATRAKEAGLEPLADCIAAQQVDGNPQVVARDFINPEKGIEDTDAALKGARDILAERLAETVAARSLMRQAFNESGQAVAEIVADKAEEKTKFDQYREFSESVKTIPSHRLLAIRRGHSEKVLRIGIDVDLDPVLPALDTIAGVDNASPFAEQLRLAVRDGVKRLLQPQIETEVWVDLKVRADEEAVGVFAQNLQSLLLGAPLGERCVVGIDPGMRTGCKVAVLDSTGRYLENCTLFLTSGEPKKQQAEALLSTLLQRHQPFAIAVGNGTGGREAETWLREILRAAKQTAVIIVTVNESGASVYSASDIAREEFPELDLTVRGAISIARRLQDPLAELVKIDPKAIGVGQYQHDVHQPLLAKKLDEVVEDCVNRVGVEVNTASAPLLARVAGIGSKLAKKVVAHRDAEGAFDSRKRLMKVSGFGARAFEQAAGFLRVRSSAHALDASAVHPERYAVVEKMAGDLDVELRELVGNNELVSRIDIRRYVSDEVGEPTLEDIIAELKKPGRDPRAEFVAPAFRSDVNRLEDLKAGMQLEGVITNVTNFGAFVDIGVHQDGLVHISQLADRFVRDPHEVAKTGQRIQVRVLEVDLDRRRVSLSARRKPDRPKSNGPPTRAKAAKNGCDDRREQKRQEKFTNNPFSQLKR